MKAATVKELKIELANYSDKDLIEICLKLAKFKKENKELLTYLLYESEDEASYINSIKSEIELQFEEINSRNYYFIKKSVRKILRDTKKYIRYSKKKDTEVEILIHFCQTLKDFKPTMNNNRVLKNIYLTQVAYIKRLVPKLHEDLQYDYGLMLEELTSNN